MWRHLWIIPYNELDLAWIWPNLDYNSFLSLFQRGQLCIEEAFLSKNILNMEMPTVEIPDEKDQRFCVLSYEQVKRLNDLMSDVISIHGRGNFPTIDVKLCDLVTVVRRKLEEDGVHVKEIRLNGSGASSVRVRFVDLLLQTFDILYRQSSVKITFGNLNLSFYLLVKFPYISFFTLHKYKSLKQ